ncbi:hypothetical protein [Microbacterium sp. CH12i]|uniref:hypothetical protein n=1 Tax=Microbacterium sp. CH12i TaxID=1479651 RepID=UPI002E10A403
MTGHFSRLREVAPDGVDLILDLVGGEALRDVAELVTNSTRIISAADATTANQLGGAALERTAEVMAKITDVIKYGLVNPHVSALYPPRTRRRSHRRRRGRSCHRQGRHRNGFGMTSAQHWSS